MLGIRIAWDRPARPPDGVTEHVLLLGLTPQGGLANLPANLCILLDCSGSMEGPKLEEAKAACRLAVQCLSPDDLISLVTFNSQPTPRFTAQRRQTLTDADLDAQLAQIKAEDVTRTDLALAEGEKVLRPNAGPGRVSAVLLITDGHPTDPGGTPLEDYDSFYDQAARLAASGISVVAVGLGSAENYNSTFLTALADRGRGAFCYAPEAAELGIRLREQVRAAQATVIAGLEIGLVPDMNGVRLKGFCRVTPGYLPFDLSGPDPQGGWRIPCGTLEAETAGAETIFLARVEAPGMFGFGMSGTYPVLAVSVSWQQAAGSRASAPETVASLNYTPILREQQAVTAEVQQIRLRWEMNMYQDELGRTSDIRRTGQLLQQIAAAAGGLGMVNVVDQVNAQLDHLRRTGRLDADNLTRTSQLLRETGRLSSKGMTDE